MGKKLAVVYWSGTGNTEMMANAVMEGIVQAGNEGTLLTSAEFSSADVDNYEAIAFGCPAMGSEVLEEGEFDPMFTEVETALSGKRIALFGSYGWGSGDWMNDWEDRCNAAGAKMACDSVICMDAPDDDANDNLVALGKVL